MRLRRFTANSIKPNSSNIIWYVSGSGTGAAKTVFALSSSQQLHN